MAASTKEQPRLTDDELRQVNRFCRQYLQLEGKLDYPSGQLLRLASVQERLYAGAFDEDNLRYGPPTRQRFQVLKELVSRIENAIDDWDEYEISDDLLSALSELLATPLPSEFASVQQKCYSTYVLSALVVDDPQPEAPPSLDAASTAMPHVTLLENRFLLAASGTTGLRTWEAALHLGQYLCKNPVIVRGKRVLELGAGTGYLSILCAKLLGAEHAIASDGADDVLECLPDNFFLNGLQGSGKIAAMDLKWGHALMGTEEEQWNGGRPVDVVLGADVIYDMGLIPVLVSTLHEVFALYPGAEVFISATERNQGTHRAFLDRCHRTGLVVHDIDFEVPIKSSQDGPFYNDQVAIRIRRISKKPSS